MIFARTATTRKLHLTIEPSSFKVSKSGKAVKFIDQRLSLCDKLVIADEDFGQEDASDKLCLRCAKIADKEYPGWRDELSDKLCDEDEDIPECFGLSHMFTDIG